MSTERIVQISPEEAENLFGKVIYEDDDCVIRLSKKAIDGVGNEVVVKAHRQDVHGHEGLPRGYMLGSNMLILKVRS